MSTNTAIERGRHLIITIGADDPDTAVEVTVKPINAKLGGALFALYMGIAFGQSEHPETDALNMSKIAVGEENWPLLEGETDVVLRAAEVELIISLATLWNVQAGGIELVEILLSDGAPKAREALMERGGMGDAYRLLISALDSGLMTSPSSESENATPSQGASNGTSTRPTSGTASRLPANRRSIRQN